MSRITHPLIPENVERWFNFFSQTPRGSLNEEAIQTKLVTFAKERNLEVEVDAKRNVMIRKKSSKKKEMGNLPSVCLQGHSDMVCVAQPGRAYNKLVDPIIPYIEGEGDDMVVRGDGTSLGADNGIATAVMLAILDSDLPHPPLECLFTVEEETGMIGAQAVSKNMIKSKYLINLDNMDSDTICIGCAGSISMAIKKHIEAFPISTLISSISPPASPVAASSSPSSPSSLPFALSSFSTLLPPTPALADFSVYRVGLSQCASGHSGFQIHYGRLNAIKGVARLVQRVLSEHNPANSVDGRVVLFLVENSFGGLYSNVIAAEGYFTLLVYEGKKDTTPAKPADTSSAPSLFETSVRAEYAALKAEYATVEPHLALELKRFPLRGLPLLATPKYVSSISPVSAVSSPSSSASVSSSSSSSSTTTTTTTPPQSSASAAPPSLTPVLPIGAPTEPKAALLATPAFPSASLLSLPSPRSRSPHAHGHTRTPSPRTQPPTPSTLAPSTLPPALNVLALGTAAPSTALRFISAAHTRGLLAMLLCVPHGLISRTPEDLADEVATQDSVNCAPFCLSAPARVSDALIPTPPSSFFPSSSSHTTRPSLLCASITFFMRSLYASEMEATAQKIRALCRIANLASSAGAGTSSTGTGTLEGGAEGAAGGGGGEGGKESGGEGEWEMKPVFDFPPWLTDGKTQLYQWAAASFQQVNQKKPKRIVVHAGYETCIWHKNYPEMEMISIGPRIDSPHTTEEKLYVRTIRPFYELVAGILNMVA